MGNAGPYFPKIVRTSQRYGLPTDRCTFSSIKSHVCQRIDINTRFVVLTASLLKIQIFWDVTPCRLVNLHVQVQVVEENCSKTALLPVLCGSSCLGCKGKHRKPSSQRFCTSYVPWINIICTRPKLNISVLQAAGPHGGHDATAVEGRLPPAH